jgi:phage nucleotide-binding protein
MKILNTKNSGHQKVKAIIYGESSSGKTTLAKTLNGKTLIVSAEAGLLSLAGCDIDYVDISVDDKGEVIKEPAERIRRLSDTFKMLHTDTGIYDNVLMDGITEIGELLVEGLNKEFPDRKDTFPMWGEYAKRMRSIVKGFRDLPYNVFITAVAEPDKDENNRRFMGFQVPGSISRKLPQYFDEVFYLHVDADGKRSIVTKKTDAIIAKDRSNKLDAIEEPDLGKIISKIFINDQKEKGKVK